MAVKPRFPPVGRQPDAAPGDVPTAVSEQNGPAGAPGRDAAPAGPVPALRTLARPGLQRPGSPAPAPVGAGPTQELPREQIRRYLQALKDAEELPKLLRERLPPDTTPDPFTRETDVHRLLHESALPYLKGFFQQPPAWKVHQRLVELMQRPGLSFGRSEADAVELLRWSAARADEQAELVRQMAQTMHLYDQQQRQQWIREYAAQTADAQEKVDHLYQQALRVLADTGNPAAATQFFSEHMGALVTQPGLHGQEAARRAAVLLQTLPFAGLPLITAAASNDGFRQILDKTANEYNRALTYVHAARQSALRMYGHLLTRLKVEDVIGDVLDNRSAMADQDGTYGGYPTPWNQTLGRLAETMLGSDGSQWPAMERILKSGNPIRTLREEIKAGNLAPTTVYGFTVAVHRLLTDAYQMGLMEEDADLNSILQLLGIMNALFGPATDMVFNPAITMGGLGMTILHAPLEVQDAWASRAMQPYDLDTLTEMTGLLTTIRDVLPTATKVIASRPVPRKLDALARASTMQTLAAMLLQYVPPYNPLWMDAATAERVARTIWGAGKASAVA